MIDKSRLKWILLFADVGIFAGCCVAYTNLSRHLDPHVMVGPYLFSLMLLLVMCTYIFDGYNLDSQLMNVGAASRTAVAAGFALLLALFFTYLTGTTVGDHLGRQLILCTLGVTVVVGLGLRLLFARWMKKSDRLATWLVVIRTEQLDKFDRSMNQRLRYSRFRYLTEVPSKHPSAVGTWADLKGHLGQRWAGLIVAWTDDFSKEFLGELVKARMHGRFVISAEDFYEKSLEKIPVDWIDQRLLLKSSGSGLLLSPISFRIQRIIDLVLVLLFSPIVVPLVALSGLLVFLESGWPIFYSQERMGWNNQIFKIRKLRTMIKDAERDGVQWAQIDDPRITRVGWLLRRTRLDELPQFWNILIGQMSLIGPRPERPEFCEQISSSVPQHSLRLHVRPGLTGWAQVCYRYGASLEDAVEKLEYDLYYIKNHSLLLNFRILVKTIRVIALGAGR